MATWHARPHRCRRGWLVWLRIPCEAESEKKKRGYTHGGGEGGQQQPDKTTKVSWNEVAK